MARWTRHGIFLRGADRRGALAAPREFKSSVLFIGLLDQPEYATAAKATAEDGRETNSPFTTTLVRYLTEPGFDVRIALGKVRDAVVASTNGHQMPYHHASIGGDTVAPADPVAGKPVAASAVPPAALSFVAVLAPDACAHADSHWEQALKFDRLEFYEEHLNRFSTCAFACFARAEIEEKKYPQIAYAQLTRTPEPTPAQTAELTVHAFYLALGAGDGDAR